MAEKGFKEGMSLREASDFWDEHEFGEFEDAHQRKGPMATVGDCRWNNLILCDTGVEPR